MLLSENSLNFSSQVVTEPYNLFDTRSTFDALYHSATSGAMENANGTIESIFCKMAALDPSYTGAIPECSPLSVKNQL